MYSSKVIGASREALERTLGIPLREYSETEVLDFAARMRDIDWASGPSEGILAAQPSDIQEYVFNEIALSKIDWAYWARRYATVVDDKGRTVRFKPWPSQQDFITLLARLEEEAWDYMMSAPTVAELQARLKIILLKARQVGGTIISEILLAHLLIFFSNSRMAIASNHPDASLDLSRKLLFLLDNLPGWMRPRMDARVKATNYHFPDLNSDIIVGAGNQKTTLGQGVTIDGAHFTELASWQPENAYAIDADMVPAFNSSGKHHTLFVLESTAEGGEGNWFHDVWESAVNGTSQFKPIFISWFRCPHKYIANPSGMIFKDTTLATARRVKEEFGIELSREQLAWYQLERQDKEARGLLDVFMQEHPSSPDEAFQAGTRSIFTIEVRSKTRADCRRPVAVLKWSPSRKAFLRMDIDEWLALPVVRTKDQVLGKEENCLIIWELAEPGSVYIVGHDSSYGLGKDTSAIEVLRVGNRFSEDEQVAEFASKSLPPTEFAEILWKIGHLFADKNGGRPARMIIEVSPGSPGIVAQGDLMKRGYPNFYIWRRVLSHGGGFTNSVGWDTNMRTRPILTENGVTGLNTSNLRVNSPYLVYEMDGFSPETSPMGQRRLAAAPGYHDDRLIALFMAYYAAHELDQINLAEERRRQEELRRTPRVKPVQYQAMGITWEEAMDLWARQNGL